MCFEPLIMNAVSSCVGFVDVFATLIEILSANCGMITARLDYCTIKNRAFSNMGPSIKDI